jgi:hypothetical protein
MATVTQLATKQNTMVFQSESSAAGVIDQSTANPPVYISGWTGTVTQTSGYLSVPILSGAGTYKAYTNLTAGQTIYLTCEMQMDTVNHVIISINNGAAWAGFSETLVSGLTTTAWKPVKWEFTVPSTNSFNFHVGYLPTGSSLTQGNGTVRIRNITLSTTPKSSNFSERIHVTGAIVSQGTVSCLSLVQTSDEAIKENVQDVSLDDLMGLFDAVEVKTYTRTDVPGTRYGFIAQDVQRKLPKDISNVLFMTYEEDQPLLALDYSRLGSTVLWGVCKRQQQAIEALTLRLDALEGKKKKTTKSK